MIKLRPGVGVIAVGAVSDLGVDIGVVEEPSLQANNVIATITMIGGVFFKTRSSP